MCRLWGILFKAIHFTVGTGYLSSHALPKPLRGVHVVMPTLCPSSSRLICCHYLQTVLEQGGQFAGINRKVQLKPLRWSTPEEGSGEQPRCVEALLILKHGGVLTHAGRQQAETLGNLFRNVMYPPSAGGGLLRLHSTYRHDLKIYSSGETSEHQLWFWRALRHAPCDYLPHAPITSINDSPLCCSCPLAHR